MTQRGRWQDHPPIVAAALERNLRAGRPGCLVPTPAGRLDVDLRRMVQKSAASSGKSSGPERKVRRVAQGEKEEEVLGQDAAAAASADVASVARVFRPIPAGQAQERQEFDGDDEAFALAMALSQETELAVDTSDMISVVLAAARGGAAARRTDDEAFAIMLARQQEEDDFAIAAALSAADTGVAGGGRHAAGDFDAALASAMAASVEHSRGTGAIDIDGMGYEELLALGERIGYASRPKPSAAELARLPTRRVGDGECEEEEECVVCCSVYEPGDELRTLPCFHSFHSGCIDAWLMGDMPGSITCPVCHSRVEWE